jgi:uncharacterized damage-inducible protein DinB
VRGVREFIESCERVYRRYKGLAEATFEVLTAEQLAQLAGAEGNSVAVLAWHISGNLRSYFTEFLTSDGEKPWRQRDSEFDDRRVTHAELRQRWAEGWDVLFTALQGLSDADLSKQVRIRGEAVAVHDALHRSLAHTSYHVGQIVFLGKSLRGAEWRSLSIPRSRPGS